MSLFLVLPRQHSIQLYNPSSVIHAAIKGLCEVYNFNVVAALVWLILTPQISLRYKGYTAYQQYISCITSAWLYQILSILISNFSKRCEIIQTTIKNCNDPNSFFIWGGVLIWLPSLACLSLVITPGLIQINKSSYSGAKLFTGPAWSATCGSIKVISEPAMLYDFPLVVTLIHRHM